MGLEVIAIEDSDFTGWLEAATTIGEVTFDSAATLVSGVVGYAQGRKVKLLHVQAHGNEDLIALGGDSIGLSNFPAHRPALLPLTTVLDADPWVDLRACEVGSNLALVTCFAALWGATVVAGRGSQNNLYDMNLGRYVTVKPDGSYETSFFTPPQVKYSWPRRAWRQAAS